MKPKLGVLVIDPSKSILNRSAASLRRVAWSGFPGFVGTIGGLRLLASPPVALRFPSLGGTTIALSLRSRSGAAPPAGLGLFTRYPPRFTVEKTRPPRACPREGGGSWGILACIPRSSTPADRRSRPFRSDDGAFRSDKHVGSAHVTFEALSRGLHAPWVRFAARVAPAPRNTRFRPVASLAGQDFHLLDSIGGFRFRFIPSASLSSRLRLAQCRRNACSHAASQGAPRAGSRCGGVRP